MMEGVSSTMIHCKNVCKCHNVPSVQQQYDNKKDFKESHFSSLFSLRLAGCCCIHEAHQV
jgi:hypothetical protein